MTDEILKEIDDALRAERLVQLWHRHAQQIIFFSALIVIALITLLIWRDQQQTQKIEQSDQLLQASIFLAAGKEEQATNLLEALTQSDSAHSQLARFYLAAGSIKRGEPTHARAWLSPLARLREEQPLLASIACTSLNALGNSAEDVSCQPIGLFAPLQQEFALAHRLSSSDEISQIHVLMEKLGNGRSPLHRNRLGMIKRYIHSHHPLPKPAEKSATEPQDASGLTP